jgi:hypothetical protein
MANDPKNRPRGSFPPYQPVFRNKRGPHLSARKGTQKDVPLLPNGEPRPKDMLARQALDTGRLVRPFDLAIRLSRAYYLVMGPIASATRHRSSFAIG